MSQPLVKPGSDSSLVLQEYAEKFITTVTNQAAGIGLLCGVAAAALKILYYTALTATSTFASQVATPPFPMSSSFSCLP